MGSPRGWTYGAEHEWADWPLDRALPGGYKRDVRDITIVNSNGIANDPTGKLYGFGGEINTPPTSTLTGQVECLRELKALLPEAKVNYRSNLHIHIRVPGLGQDLAALKRVQRYIHDWMPRLLRHVEPLPRPESRDFPDCAQYEGALRRWKRRRVSHQTLLTHKRVQHQLAATTLEEFYNREVPQSKAGKPLWHCQPRLCVNLRQHKETDTVEFRHFPGTLCEGEMFTALSWCSEFMNAALEGVHPEFLENMHPTGAFPQFPPYIHWMEERYRCTVHDGTVSKEEIALNIQLFLQEGIPE